MPKKVNLTVFVSVVLFLNVFMVKERYYKNQNLRLAWDRIGLRLVTPLYPTCNIQYIKQGHSTS